MPRIAITGHTRLSAATENLVYEALCHELRHYPAGTLHGITCLAAGADQLFARAITAVGATFDAILPARDYRDAVVDDTNRPEFDELVRLAESVTRMPFARSGRRAYTAANAELLRRCDVLFAVWDGGRAMRQGETAEVVNRARAISMTVRVLWPVNAVRL